MKKLLFNIGVVAGAASPIAVAVSCGGGITDQRSISESKDGTHTMIQLNFYKDAIVPSKVIDEDTLKDIWNKSSKNIPVGTLTVKVDGFAAVDVKVSTAITTEASFVELLKNTTAVSWQNHQINNWLGVDGTKSYWNSIKIGPEVVGSIIQNSKTMGILPIMNLTEFSTPFLKSNIVSSLQINGKDQSLTNPYYKKTIKKQDLLDHNNFGDTLATEIDVEMKKHPTLNFAMNIEVVKEDAIKGDDKNKGEYTLSLYALKDSSKVPASEITAFKNALEFDEQEFIKHNGMYIYSVPHGWMAKEDFTNVKVTPIGEAYQGRFGEDTFYSWTFLKPKTPTSLDTILPSASMMGTTQQWTNKLPFIQGKLVQDQKTKIWSFEGLYGTYKLINKTKIVAKFNELNPSQAIGNNPTDIDVIRALTKKYTPNEPLIGATSGSVNARKKQALKAIPEFNETIKGFLGVDAIQIDGLSPLNIVEPQLYGGTTTVTDEAAAAVELKKYITKDNMKIIFDSVIKDPINAALLFKNLPETLSNFTSVFETMSKILKNETTFNSDAFWTKIATRLKNNDKTNLDWIIKTLKSRPNNNDIFKLMETENFMSFGPTIFNAYYVIEKISEAINEELPSN